MNRRIIVNNPQNIFREWEKFIQGNPPEKTDISEYIIKSWQRCREMKVDPFSNVILPAKQRELDEKKSQKRYLIEASVNFMKSIYNLLKGYGYQIVLSDEEGLLLEVMGDPNFIKRTRQVQLSPGGNWSEMIKGTNAIGTALAEDTPIQVHATEHFCKPNHFLTCSAAPIHNPDGKLIGVLDITGDYMFYNQYTLAMVVACVSSIENDLKYRRETTKSYFFLNLAGSLCDSLNEGLIIFDHTGKIKSCNKKANHLLRLFEQNFHERNYNEIIDSVIKSEHSVGLNNTVKLIKNDFINDDFGNCIASTIRIRENKNKNSNMQLAYKAFYDFKDIVGSSEAIKTAKALALKAAKTNINVLITGESGTGKELFAQAIHNSSLKSNGPFVPVHCAAIPETLLESELFGYEDGAFTGAKKEGQVGKFELANGGTIFLDEISELSLNGQVKLLRVIQTRRFQRLASNKLIEIDTKIISATNKDLFSEVNSGNFRKDLYYRLNVMNIKIPPLRDRLEDIDELVIHFINKYAKNLGLSDVKIHKNFIKKLKKYHWPGNVRELENVIERAMALMDNHQILSDELVIYDYQNETDINTNKQISENLNLNLDDIELKVILETIRNNNGNISKTARDLGIGRATIYRKIRQNNQILNN